MSFSTNPREKAQCLTWKKEIRKHNLLQRQVVTFEISNMHTQAQPVTKLM